MLFSLTGLLLGGCSPGNRLQIQFFDVLPRPGCAPQELEAGLDAWLIVKTADWDEFRQLAPAILLHKPGKHHFQCNAMQGVFGLKTGHHNSPLNARSSTDGIPLAGGSTPNAGLSTPSGDSTMQHSGAHLNFRPFGHGPPDNWLKKEVLLTGLSNSSALNTRIGTKKGAFAPFFVFASILTFAQKANIEACFSIPCLEPPKRFELLT